MECNGFLTTAFVPVIWRKQHLKAVVQIELWLMSNILVGQRDKDINIIDWEEA